MGRVFALVWKKVKELCYLWWAKDGATTPEEVRLEPAARIRGLAREAEALSMRAQLINGMTPQDTVLMEMGGVGDIAALLMYYRGVTVRRVPARRLKEARQGTDKSNDHRLIAELYREHPDWFYDMTLLDAKVAELKELVIWLYIIQRKIRIPTKLRLISILRDRILIQRAKAGQALAFPSVEQIHREISPEDAEPEMDEETGEEKETESKPKHSPEVAEIITQIKRELADDPNLQAAARREKKLEKEIADLLPEIPAWTELFETINGIGPRIGGRLIAWLITPKRFTPGGFQAYCGWTLTREGTIQRFARGGKVNFHPEVKQALFAWIMGIIKNRASPWRRWFLRIKQNQRDGWTENGQRFPGYTEKRVTKIMTDPEEVRRFVDEDHLRKRLNQALRTVLGEDAKRFNPASDSKIDKDAANQKLFEFLAGPANADTARRIWTSVFDPELWKMHVHRMAIRKMFKYFGLYIYNRWCRLDGMTFRQNLIDWTEQELARAA